ncbi:uncharacterized protein LOC132760658 [Ruditapes philippinarum]|uniref:uncharacterized protein LOC132760658 n=1 Tax=Ruditapes philippinarum TaxID=129788 RepID=UPI00295B460E|nr:uncharacterized protein LOC132760658 [Ruditapes philippinarum]
MASTNKELPEYVETDNASLLYIKEIKEEETGESLRYVACSEKTYNVCYPPEKPQVRYTLSFSKRQDLGFEHYQCSQNKNDLGSGSDSGEEENSPYGSPEAIAPSGRKPKAVVSMRQRPDYDYYAFAAYTEQKRPVVMANENIRQQDSEPYANEETCINGNGTLALSGSSTETTTPLYKRNGYCLAPLGEMTTQSNDTSKIYTKRLEPFNRLPTKDKFEDVNMRLATFFEQVDWPHTYPTAEMMASAGFIFKGVYTVNETTTIYDMVECYKCGGTLYGFTETDDPAEEHRSHYPNCN